MKITLEQFRFPVLLVLAAVAVPLSLYAPKALVPLLVLLWLPVLRLKPAAISAVFGTVLVMVLWCLFESFRMVHPFEALKLWARVTLLVMCGIACLAQFRALEEHQKLRLSRVLAGGMVLALVMCVLDIVSGGGILGVFRSVFGSPDKVTELNMLNRGACFMALAVWPAMLAVARLWPGRLYLPLLLWIASFLVISQLESMSATMGIACGAVAFGWVKFLPRWKSVLAGVVVLMLAVTPFAMLKVEPDQVASAAPSIPLSFLHRLHIWKFASHKAAEKPWLGYGFHGAGTVEGADEPIVVKGQTIEDLKNLPGHTHNNMVQLWLELGVPGVALYVTLAALLFAAVLRNRDLPPSAQAAFAAIFTAYVTIGMTAFGIWQEWWIAGGFLAAVLTGALGYAPASSALASAQNPITSSASGRSVGSMPT